MLLAIKDLSIHVLRVYKALRADDLKRARKEVSMIVGRDTKEMDEKEIIRASIETVAENLVDGITAPLFYAFLFGLPGIALYKGINTLDSLWGHKDDRFFYFGKFAARIDDCANYIPARLTAPLISLACFFFGCSPLSSLKVLIRDRNKHPSPNAGYPESAMAGALRIKLGGKNSYNGIISFRPELGDGIEVIKCQHIKKSLGIVLLSTFFFYFLFLTMFT
jgi:adenosylcobinamide-phosphate synthase